MTSRLHGAWLDAALSLHRVGFSVIPVPFMRKGPVITGWQSLRYSEAELPATFAAQCNIGVLLGEPSRWMVDIDLDHPRAVEVAREFLPDTGMTFGRNGKPESHWIYRLTAPAPTRKWVSRTDGMIVELRSTGCQTIAPGSVHPSGEDVRWDRNGEPAEIDPAALIEAVDAMVRAVASDAAMSGGGLPLAGSGGTAYVPGPVTGGMVMDEEMRAAVAAQRPSGKRGLSRSTMLFLIDGAPEGARNESLFKAACDYAGCDVPQSDAERDLGEAGRRCGLDDREVALAIKSAYTKPRSPTRTTMRPAVVEESTQPGDAPAADEPEAKAVRFCLSNVIDAWKEVPKVVTRGGKTERTTETKHITLYKPIETVAAEVIGATRGWPKLVGGAPFIISGEGLDAVPIFLPQPPAFFGWLHREMDVRWTEKPCEDRETGGVRTPPTKGELHEAIKQGAGGIERYRLVTAYPHHPPMDGMYYIPVSLPAATGERLHEFLDSLNADTETDRGLMLAALLTMVWGGMPGTRPVFVLTAAAGVGAGKTATARALADVVGGACSLDYNESWADLSKEMMSSDEWNARVLLFDNVRGKFGGSALEAVVTAKSLTGWRSYVGRVSRPNDATVLVTFNMPELGRDMAERSVVINIGRPRHEKSFVAWAAEFVREHRLQLLADLLDILKRPAIHKINPEHGDRWQHWQREILGRIPGGDQLAATICARRPAVDSDQDDAAAICSVLLALERVHGSRGVTTYEIHQAARKAALWQDDKGKADAANRQTCIGWVRRVLSGRGVIEPKTRDDATQVRAVVHGDNGERLPGRSAVWLVNVNAASSVLGTDDEMDIPV